MAMGTSSLPEGLLQEQASTAHDDERTAEELALDREIRAIRLDTDIMKLRGQLEVQEEHVRMWREACKNKRDLSLAEEAPGVDDALPREERAEIQNALESAERAVADMQKQLEDLEALRASSAEE